MTRRDRAREALYASGDFALRDEDSAINAILAFANAELERIAILCDNYEPVSAGGIEWDTENFAAERIAERIRAIREEL